MRSSVELEREDEKSPAIKEEFGPFQTDGFKPEEPYLAASCYLRLVDGRVITLDFQSDIWVRSALRGEQICDLLRAFNFADRVAGAADGTAFQLSDVGLEQFDDPKP